MSLAPTAKQSVVTPWRPGFSRVGMACFFIIGAALTSLAWRTMEGNLQLAVALFGQLFWLLVYLDWQRSRWAPRAIRKFLSNFATRVPCQMLVVVEGIELIRDAGVLAFDRDRLWFQGQEMDFNLPAQNVEQIVPDHFGLDGRCIKLKCPDAKLTLKVLPYARFDSEAPTTDRDVVALLDALRMEMRSKAPLAELPSWPFANLLGRRLRFREWLLTLFALPFYAAIPYALSWGFNPGSFVIAFQVWFLGSAIIGRANAARRARRFVRNALEETERRTVRPPESTFAVPAIPLSPE